MRSFVGVQSSNASADSLREGTRGGADEPLRLSAGDRVGSRFTVESWSRDDVDGSVYRVIDERTRRTLSILLLDPEFVRGDAAAQSIRDWVRVAKRLQHKNVTRVYGMGREGQRHYLAAEHIDGRTLARLLERKARASKTFTLKGAYNLVAHVCNALTAAGDEIAHGVLRPSSILVNREGRVKVDRFGLAPLRGHYVRTRRRMNRWDAPCFPAGEDDGLADETLDAPGGFELGGDTGAFDIRALEAAAIDSTIQGGEEASGSTVDEVAIDTGTFDSASVSIDADSQSLDLEPDETSGDRPGTRDDDLRALGAILYALLVGAPAPVRTPELPDDVAARHPDALVDILRRCVDRESPDRYAQPGQVKTDLLAVLQQARGKRPAAAPVPVAVPAPVAVVVPLGTSVEPDEETADLPPAPPMPVGGVDATLARIAGIPAGSTVDPIPPPAPCAEDEVASRLRRENRDRFAVPDLPVGGELDVEPGHERWLFQKSDGVDLGPFSKTQLIEKLFAEELTPQSLIYDIETNLRRPFSEFAALEADAVAWIHEKAARERKRSESAAEAARRRKSQLLVAAIVVAVVGVSGSVGGYVWYRSTRPLPVKVHVARLITSMNQGLPLETLPDDPERSPAFADSGRRSRGRGGRGRNGKSKYDARALREARLAAKSAVDFGSGGGAPFSEAAVNAAMAKRSGKLRRCIESEARRNTKLRSVNVDLTVVPSGEIINVKFPNGSAEGRTCVRGALAGLVVPPFAGTNRKMSYPFTIRN